MEEPEWIVVVNYMLLVEVPKTVSVNDHKGVDPQSTKPVNSNDTNLNASYLTSLHLICRLLKTFRDVEYFFSRKFKTNLRL